MATARTARTARNADLACCLHPPPAAARDHRLEHFGSRIRHDVEHEWRSAHLVPFQAARRRSTGSSETRPNGRTEEGLAVLRAKRRP